MVRRNPEPNTTPLPPPAATIEGRQNQLIAAAYDLAEERIHNKSASAQEVVHFLKQGSIRERLELKKLEREVEVLQTRVKEMESRKSSEELYSKALAAMKKYSGSDVELEDEFEEDFYE